jgi:membrane protein
VKKLSRLQRLWESAEALLTERPVTAPDRLSRLQRFLHFCVLVWGSFSRNRCPVRASGLAYVTLLSLIPLLAVVMSVTSTFLKKEGEDQIDKFIMQLVASVTPPAMLSTNGVAGTNGVTEAAAAAPEDQPPDGASGTNATQLVKAASQTNAIIRLAQEPEAVKARKEAARAINEFIQNTRSGALGLTGSVLLIFAAISLLSRIETTFNDIWGVERGRGWFTRIVTYWGVISLAPLLLVLAVGLASGPHFEGTKKLIAATPFIGHFLFQFLPVALLCLTFAAFYMLMPNTKVDWRAALVGGVVGGLLLHANNLLSVLYVSRVVSNSKIYGSLALVPVFMIGLYFAWLILLFGAQVAYAFQNRRTYLEEKQVETINQRGREFVALRLLTLIGHRYLRGEPAPTVDEMGNQIGVPTRLIQQIMQTLAAARLVVATAGPAGGYLPARPMETITCHDILLALRASHGQELATRDEPTRSEVYGEFQRIQEAERTAASSVTMLDLSRRADAQLSHSSSFSLPNIATQEV